ncbi:hypothetical protein SEEH1567_05378, partial [Salmonella enterica subsp. enterica serovar Heidelberg str. 41567]
CPARGRGTGDDYRGAVCYAPNKFEALATCDALVQAHGA